MFKLTIDSREQRPLDFRAGLFDQIEVDGLPFGDYWAEIDGTPIPIAFERKSLADLFGTMTSGYDRFKKEMKRAKENNFSLVLMIEGSMMEIHSGFKYCQFSGEAMLKKLAMLRVRYDLEFHFFNSRREMARYIEEIFDAVRRNYKKESKDEECNTGRGNGASRIQSGGQTAGGEVLKEK